MLIETREFDRSGRKFVQQMTLTVESFEQERLLTWLVEQIATGETVELSTSKCRGKYYLHRSQPDVVATEHLGPSR